MYKCKYSVDLLQKQTLKNMCGEVTTYDTFMFYTTSNVAKET